MESVKGRINEALQFANREMGKGLGRQLLAGVGGGRFCKNLTPVFTKALKWEKTDWL